MNLTKVKLEWLSKPYVDLYYRVSSKTGPIILNAVTCVRSAVHTWQFLFKLYETGVRENEPH
jgi:hypothetical protein